MTDPPPNPIFVFTDDLSVHRSFTDAADYHEYRKPLVAFDRNGDVFEIPPFMGTAPVPLNENRRDELIRRLRHYLIRLAIDRPDLLKMSKWDIKRAPADDIIRLAVRWFLIPEPPPREHWRQFWRPRAT